MKNYPLFKVHVDTDSALSQLRDVFESGFINEGIQVTELTNKLSEILDHKNLIVVRPTFGRHSSLFNRLSDGERDLSVLIVSEIAEIEISLGNIHLISC